MVLFESKWKFKAVAEAVAVLESPIQDKTLLDQGVVLEDTLGQCSTLMMSQMMYQ